MLYLDQIFDEIFNNFFSFPERSRLLLKDATKDDSLQKQFPSYPVSNYYLESNGTNVMEFALPGFTKEDLDVSVVDNILTIDAEKRDEEEKTEVEGRTYVCRRLAKRSFKNSYKLPSAADIEHIDVQMKDGMLRIAVPLKEEAQRKPKQLEIK